MDEGDVLLSLSRNNSSQNKSSRSWTMPSTIFSAYERKMQTRIIRSSITKKKPIPTSTTSSISLSEYSANSTNPSNTQSQESSCKTMAPVSTPAVHITQFRSLL